MKKINLQSPRFLWTVFAVCIFVGIAITWSFEFQNGSKAKLPQGSVVFRRLNSDFGEYEYYILDGDGNNRRYLGNYLGAPAISPDGESIALSCADDVGKICILDTAKNPKTKQEINLPAECIGLIDPNFGLKSISWAPRGDKLAVVCKRDDIDSPDQKVCILSLNNENAYCWEEFNKDVDYAVWSPVDDLLLVSTEGSLLAEIYLVEPDGRDPVFITHGWAAEWSPDGNQIVFAQWQNTFFWLENGTPRLDETVNQYAGIALINIDGSDFQWLYRNDEEEWAVVRKGAGRLSWSPDGQHILIQSIVGGIGGMFEILRLDIETQEIICLACVDDQYRINIDPDWGP